jgi:DNA-binding response OmpR family regulator
VRILWADDQPDVVATFRPLLAPLRAKIASVGSGEEALDQLSRGYFDVAIVDLMMPPEPWGGLWLLERMQAAGIQVPVLVLSGEGSQRETIQALRLGARDYVSKDAVETELLERIRSLVESERDRAERYLLEEAPALLAVPLKRYRAALDPVQRLRRLIEFQEAALRFAAFLGLAEARSSQAIRRLSAQQLSIAGFAAPTMGTWNHLRTVLARVLPEAGAAAAYGAAFDNRLTERVLKLRNEIAHGGEPSARSAEEILHEVDGGVTQLIGRLRHLGGNAAIPIAMQLRGGQLEITSALLKGDSLALSAATLTAPAPVVTNHVYMVGDDPEPQWLDLYPLVVARPALEPTAWEVFAFDGIEGRRGASQIDSSDPLRFADVWSQRRDVQLADHPTAADLHGFAADWTG